MGYKANSGFAILLVVVLYFVRRQRQRDDVARRDGCAHPVKHRPMELFTGFDFQMKMHMDIPSLYRLHQRYGNTFHVGSIVSLPAVITIATENIQAITTSKDWGVEPMRLAGMEYFCGRGFITTDGDTWYRSRKLLKPSFDRNNLRDLSILSSEVDKFLDNLPKDGSTVDLQPLLYVMFLNSALYFVLGVHPSEESDDAPLTSDTFVKSFHDALVYSMFRTLLGKAWNLLPQSKYIKTCATAHNFVDYYVDQALDNRSHSESMNATHKDGSSKRSLMQGLSSQTNDRDYIRYQVIQGMMAAQDTTSELLTNSLFLLARDPESWKRLREEVSGKGDDLLQPDQLLGCKVIEHILLETLRLCPIFPLLGRVALRDTKLPVGGGPDQDLPIFVPKGTMGAMSYYAVHRDTTVFGDDVETFRPDRWYSIWPAQWEFLGFGAGNRACLGQQKAMIEASYVLARMARALETLESRDSAEWKGELKLTCKSANGCKVAFPLTN